MRACGGLGLVDVLDARIPDLRFDFGWLGVVPRGW